MKTSGSAAATCTSKLQNAHIMGIPGSNATQKTS